MRVIIDRFEGDFAVVETESGDFANLPALLVPKAKEGDVIDIEINSDETEKRIKRINRLMNKLFED